MSAPAKTKTCLDCDAGITGQVTRCPEHHAARERANRLARVRRHRKSKKARISKPAAVPAVAPDRAVSSLGPYEEACRAVAAARTTDEAKGLRDKADALRVYAHQAKNKTLEIDAAEIRIRAERRLGEIIKQQKETTGLNKGGRRHSTGSPEAPVDALPTLADAGIDKKLSSRAQKMAAVPEPEFESRIGEWRDEIEAANTKVTVNLLKAGAKERKRRDRTETISGGCDIDDLRHLAASGRRYGVIYADPPWTFESWSEKGTGRSAGQHYDLQTADDILAMPVELLAQDDCTLFLWTTWTHLELALQVIAAWGFTYKTCGFCWMKQNRNDEGLFMGNGYYSRANTEVCLLATKGAPGRLAADVRQALLSPRLDHSRKPDEIRQRITALSAGPYLELYARRPAKDWTCWGNEISRDDFLKNAKEG